MLHAVLFFFLFTRQSLRNILNLISEGETFDSHNSTTSDPQCRPQLKPHVVAERLPVETQWLHFFERPCSPGGLNSICVLLGFKKMNITNQTWALVCSLWTALAETHPLPILSIFSISLFLFLKDLSLWRRDTVILCHAVPSLFLSKWWTSVFKCSHFN